MGYGLQGVVGQLAQMCVYAWQTDGLSGGELGRLPDCSIRIGEAHLVL